LGGEKWRKEGQARGDQGCLLLLKYTICSAEEIVWTEEGRKETERKKNPIISDMAPLILNT
jgi:hypothetical protein